MIFVQKASYVYKLQQYSSSVIMSEDFGLQIDVDDENGENNNEEVNRKGETFEEW